MRENIRVATLPPLSDQDLVALGTLDGDGRIGPHPDDYHELRRPPLMTPLRWGLIGASDIAAARALPVLRRFGHEVVGVMSSSVQRGRAFANANALDWVTSDLDTLLGCSEIDAVYISTSNELHRPQTLAAAAAGKHVLCEKPVALTLNDAWAMVDGCEDAGVTLAINHPHPATGAASHDPLARRRRRRRRSARGADLAHREAPGAASGLAS